MKRGAQVGRDYLGFGVVECYERPNPRGDEIALLHRPEDVAHAVRIRSRTPIDEKLERGEPITLAEIVETYQEFEQGPFGMKMPSPESVKAITEKAAVAQQRGLLISEDEDTPAEIESAATRLSPDSTPRYAEAMPSLAAYLTMMRRDRSDAEAAEPAAS